VDDGVSVVSEWADEVDARFVIEDGEACDGHGRLEEPLQRRGFDGAPSWLARSVVAGRR